MEKQIGATKSTTDIESGDSCKKCYMEMDDNLDSCPVVVAIRRKCNTSTGSPGIYSQMAMRILSRATVKPIQAIDAMDELFNDTDSISQSSMTTRFNNGLRGIKRALGGGIVQEDTASGVQTYQIDPVELEIWCRTNKILSNRISVGEVPRASVAEQARLERYKEVTDLPDVTQLILNYLKDEEQGEDMTEAELFGRVNEKLSSIISETGRPELVIMVVEKARSLVLSAARERQVYKKNRHGSSRFSRLEAVIRPYQTTEITPEDE